MEGEIPEFPDTLYPINMVGYITMAWLRREVKDVVQPVSEQFSLMVLMISWTPY